MNKPLNGLCLFGSKTRGYYYYKKLDDIFEGGNTVPHENLYIRKTNLLNTLEIAEIQQTELLKYTKEL